MKAGLYNSQTICGVYFCVSFLTLTVGQLMEKLQYDCVVCTSLFCFVFFKNDWFGFVRIRHGGLNMRGCASACLIGIVHTLVSVSHPLQWAQPLCCCFHHLSQPSVLKPVKICMRLFQRECWGKGVTSVCLLTQSEANPPSKQLTPLAPPNVGFQLHCPVIIKP